MAAEPTPQQALMTAEQQAALADLTNGWTRERVLEAIAVTGSIEGAAPVAGFSARSIHRHAAADPQFAAEVAQAKRRAGEKVFSRVIGAAINATDEQLILHPTIAAIGINALLPEYRPNGPTINIDNRSVTVGDFKAAWRMLKESGGDGVSLQMSPDGGAGTRGDTPPESTGKVISE